jgi:hypothetical protein
LKSLRILATIIETPEKAAPITPDTGCAVFKELDGENLDDDAEDDVGEEQDWSG